MDGSARHYLSLSDADLAGLGLGPADIRAAVADAVRASAAGRLATAPKSALVPGDGRYLMTTLSTAAAPPLSVVKSVTVAPGNAARGLAGIEGAILVQESETGLLRAVMGSGWITGVRTAALSALAAERLARADAAEIAMVGAGLQARTHLEAFADLFPLRGVRIFGRGAKNIARLAALAEGRGLSVRVADRPEAALTGADLVVTSVTLDYTLSPFLDARWLKPGAFAAITDLGIPWRPDGMAACAHIVIDDRAQEAASPTKLVDPALVTADLAELLGSPAPGPDQNRPSAFVFRGLAAGDFALAALALRSAEAKGVGQRVPFPAADESALP